MKFCCGDKSPWSVGSQAKVMLILKNVILMTKNGSSSLRIVIVWVKRARGLIKSKITTKRTLTCAYFKFLYYAGLGRLFFTNTCSEGLLMFEGNFGVLLALRMLWLCCRPLSSSRHFGFETRLDGRKQCAQSKFGVRFRLCLSHGKIKSDTSLPLSECMSLRSWKTFDATVAKTSLKIASSSLLMCFVIGLPRKWISRYGVKAR